jgi:PAS domain S-box-containing protein
MYSDIESRQRELTGSISSQINSYLTAAMVTVKGSAEILQGRDTVEHIRYILDAQLAASDSISVIYGADRSGHITVISLPKASDARIQELLQLDISHNSFFKNVLRNPAPVWSDTFLSLVSGRLSVAYAVPVNEKIFIGESRLDQLTLFLKRLNEKHKTLILLTDHTGRVIAGHDERFTAQQLDISNIPIVKSGISSESPVTGRFQFEGQSMIGSTVKISSASWGVLVAQPVEVAYQTVWVTTGIAAVGFLTAVLLGITMALLMARKLGARFESLAVHARRLVDEEGVSEWPKSNILEIQRLAESLSQMAGTLCKRSNELQVAKEYSENLIKVANMIIISLDMSGCVTMMNQTAETITGYTLAELKGKSWFEIVTPQDISQQVCEEFERIKQQSGSGTFENPIVNKNGDKRIIAWHNNPIIENGDVVGMVSFGSDITEKKKNQQLQLENALINRSLEIAQEIQQSFLPVCPETLPGMLMACACEPAAHVGGDYYDLFHFEDGGVDVVIADITGHSVGSSLLMTETRSVLHAKVNSNRTPGKMLSELNNLLLNDLAKAEMQISMFYARIDTDSRRLSYSNAGHCRPLFYSAKQGAVSQLDADGLIIGVMPDVVFEELFVQFESHDMLLLYTDGIIEGESRDGEPFGIDRLGAILLRYHNQQPKQVIRGILDELTLFTGTETRADDVAIFVIKFVPG